MNAKAGDEIIRDLWADPQEFNDAGQGYDLLQAYFEGFPLETLQPLLRSNIPLVQRAAIFVASELGDQARDLIGDVIPLLRSADRYLRYHAMEVLAVCCKDEDGTEFAQVLLQLESDDQVLRALAMRLASKADISQLEAACRFFGHNTSRQSHKEGSKILGDGGNARPHTIAAMIDSPDPLRRRYGAIAAKRLRKEFPDLLRRVEASDDSDLRCFYQEAAREDPDRGDPDRAGDPDRS